MGDKTALSDRVWAKIARAVGLPTDNVRCAAILFEPNSPVTVAIELNTTDEDSEEITSILEQYTLVPRERGEGGSKV